MANGVNRAIILGNLGADPELRYTQGGTAVANISVATSESWKDKQTGEKQEKTEWHRVVFFARLAEVVGEYLRKGSKVYIEGRIQTRKWQNKEGQDVYTTEIVANEMQMLDSKGANGDQGNAPQGGYPQQHGPQPQRGGQHASPAHQPQQGGAQNYRNASQGGGPQQQQQQYQAPPQQQGVTDDLDDDIPF